jgi:hypothetical protein
MSTLDRGVDGSVPPEVIHRLSTDEENSCEEKTVVRR